jgi:hypothetical protein
MFRNGPVIFKLLKIYNRSVLFHFNYRFVELYVILRITLQLILLSILPHCSLTDCIKTRDTYKKKFYWYITH